MSSKTKEFQKKLFSARRQIKITSTWRHYKGGIYRVIDHVIMTDSGDVGVKYYRIDGPEYDSSSEYDIYFVRPASEWFDSVDHTIDGNTHCFQRFVKVIKQEVWAARDDQRTDA